MKTPTNKVLAGFMAFVPIIAVIAYVLILFDFVFEVGTGPNPGKMPAGFANLFVTMGVLMLFTLVTLIYFIVHVVKNPTLTSDMRTVWVLVNIFGGFIGHIIYFFVVILPEKEHEDLEF